MVILAELMSLNVLSYMNPIKLGTTENYMKGLDVPSPKQLMLMSLHC